MKKVFFLVFLYTPFAVSSQSSKKNEAGNRQTASQASCNNWLKLTAQPSFVNIGKLNVPGTQITVEATVSRTSFSVNGIITEGDVVSKHTGPNDVNYLLRQNGASITTSNGFFVTPSVCNYQLNKVYHIAMVYDGTVLKFYRNGFLLSQIPATGDLYQNSWNTQIGYYDGSAFGSTLVENFIGYVNEVRIWNVARTQAQIRAYMNTSLPSPATQTGLLAYYTFDDLLNKQGNPAWNGTLSGAASINQAVSNCSFIPDSCEINVVTTPAIPSFSTPDTVCVNTPVKITNTSIGASSYHWDFCVSDISSSPTGYNLGNPGNYFSQPVFVDFAEDNGNFYGFVVNHTPGGIVRLDFGSSLLNPPVPVFLGNPGGVMNNFYGNEGIQIVKNEGKWYGIIVGGSPASMTTPKIVKIEFGASLNNNTPTGTNWGNIGNMLEPVDLYMFQENNNWYGFTVNSENNTITRFNFSNSFNNVPTGINLGNIGNLNYPTGVFAVNDNGYWRIFVVNQNGGSSLTRLDFNASLLNIPTGINLGNPNNVLQSPRDITIMKLCGKSVGFVVNAATNDIAQLNFSNLANTPTGSSLGNLGNLNFPHSISKLFRVENDLYSLITNVNNNTLTRIRFAGCTNASIASSSLQNPPPVTYNQPGTYNINLSVDDGLATQNAYCRQVVVMPPLAHSPLRKVMSCTDSVKIGANGKAGTYLWNTGATTDSIYVKSGGTYWVRTSRFGCSNTDSFAVVMQPIVLKASRDTIVCAQQPVQLNVSGAAASYQWWPAAGLSSTTIHNPIANPSVTTQYTVTGTTANGCTGKATVLVSVSPFPIINKTGDTTICHDKTIQLNASGGNSYSWLPAAGLSNAYIANPVAAPSANTTFYVTVTNSNNCSSRDSIKIAVKPAPVFAVSPDASACTGAPVQLKASGGSSYEWQPAAGLNNPRLSNPLATPTATILYTVSIRESTCNDSASLTTRITVLPSPLVKASRSNDISCTMPHAQLNASGALTYTWRPSAGLNDSTIARPVSSPGVNTLYTVKGTDANGCSGTDTVTVLVAHAGDLLFKLPNAFSPNGDGKNDCFGVSRYAGFLQNLEFSVYNRFGERIFYTTNALHCWDGKYKGVLQDAGGFAYIIKANTFCGNIFRKGMVMLIR